jgi:nucleoside-diphosphate-sugar epimerase
MPAPTILVTGGTGFLGAYILQLLIQEGYAVRATKRQNSPTDMVRAFYHQIDWVDADVTDIVALEDAFEGITTVIHCAAMVSFHPKDARKMMQVNVEGTANVVNLCLEKKIRKLIHVSSIAALGRNKDRPHLDESSKWVEGSDNSNYAISKFRSEQEVWRGYAEGLPVSIVNPAIILGSGFWNAGSAKFFTQVHDGLKFCPTGSTGFVDVRDVARFIFHLLQSEITGERFILNAQNISFKRFFQQIAEAINKKPPGITVTPLLAELAWRFEWLKEKLLGADPLVTRESARSSVSNYAYDNKKSLTVNQFSYTPLEITLRETGKQFIDAQAAGTKACLLPF